MSTSSGMHDGSPTGEQSDWNAQGYSPATGYSDGSPSDGKNPNAMGLSYLKGFGGVQKKVTRDGQPAKRRGPKPDSKPAQTRRQELNRQAQRTHRERKEQYIKALEIELMRLKEVYASESNHTNTSLEQHKMALHEYRQENSILRDILISRGVQFESELENRKIAASLQPRQASSSVGHSPGPSRTPGYQIASATSSTTPTYASMHDSTYMNGRSGSISGSQSGTTHHSHSVGPTSPLIPEYAIKQEMDPISDMPGIFEQDPQLAEEFILTLERTCHGHGEYLIRRSLGSPDTVEEAQISGHALMASCPPPTHISTVPAQMGGLQATYAYQVPDMPAADLKLLLNLSHVIKDLGEIPGGQVTPIMALQSVRGHRNYRSLTREDILGMIETMQKQVRCYGFGAVMEDFHLRDALSSLFATKPETYEGLPEIDDMYA